ncbi:MAG: hypothetical protein HOW73_45740 [Polyangiaceae bacterium]|nr:hypothetical protein [Polyangiaceae bacterium]
MLVGPRPLTFVAVALAAAIVVNSEAASAQPDAGTSQAAKDAARELATKGIELYHKGRFAEALEQIQQAEERYAAPTHRVYIARCLVGLGRLVEAKAMYERLGSEPRPREMAPAVRDAYGAAATELTALEARIPKVAIAIVGASTGAELSIDGNPRPLPAGPIDVDPGSHVVVVTNGERRAERRFSAVEGAKVEVRLELAEAVQEEEQGSLVPAIVLFSVGGAATVVGAVTGGLSLAKVSELEERCVDGHCPASDQDEADFAEALGTTSTVTFAVAGAAVVTGIVLAVVRPGGSSANTGAAATSAKSIVIDPVVAPGFIGVRGRF